MFFSILPIAFFGVVAINNRNAVSAAGCDYGWAHFEGKCYKVFPEAVHYEEAKKRCQAVQANLLSIVSETENNFVGKQVRRADPPFGSTKWLGLELKRDPSGKLTGARWQDGTSSSAYGDPLKGTDEKSGNKPWGNLATLFNMTGNCVWLNNNRFLETLWNLGPCDDKNSYMCKKSANNPLSASDCEAGWELFEGKCYKVFLEEKPFEEAKKRCQDVQANLVSIGDEAENKFVGEKVYASTNFEPIWLGLELKRDSTGKLTGASWLDGTSPSAYGDPLKGTERSSNNNPWDEGYRKPPKGNCAVMDDTSADWRLSSCGSKHFYMCKKTGPCFYPLH